MTNSFLFFESYGIPSAVATRCPCEWVASRLIASPDSRTDRRKLNDSCLELQLNSTYLFPEIHYWRALFCWKRLINVYENQSRELTYHEECVISCSIRNTPVVSDLTLTTCRQPTKCLMIQDCASWCGCDVLQCQISASFWDSSWIIVGQWTYSCPQRTGDSTFARFHDA